MDEEFFVGIDVGTTALKGIALDLSGGIVATSYLRRPIAATSAVHPDDFDSLWNAFRQLLGQLNATHNGLLSRTRCLAITGIVPNVALRSESGRAFGPLLRYSDRRAYDIELKLDSELNNGRWQNEVLSKLIWLNLNCTDRHSPLRIFSPHNWLIYCLTGEYVLDSVSAIEHGCVFDRASMKWNTPLLDRYSCDFVNWPEIANPFDIVGTIQEPIAKDLGLPASTIIAAGGPDFLASILGSGARNRRDTMVYIGTYHFGCALRVSMAEIATGAFEGQHPVEWLATNPQVGPQCEAFAQLITGAKDDDAWKAIDNLLESKPAQDESVATLVPCIQLLTSTISTQPTSAFVFDGRSLTAGSAARALVHGIAIGLQIDMENGGYKRGGAGPIHIAGSGCRSPYLRQILSNLLDCPISYTPSSEYGLGSALIAVQAALGIAFSELGAQHQRNALISLPSAVDHRLIAQTNLHKSVLEIGSTFHLRV